MKRWLTCALGGLTLATALAAGAQAADLKQLVVTEPVHSIGYLPLYVAVHKGYFAQEGLSVRVMTVDSGSGHTNAVLSGQAFAFIGGPEHNAFAKLKGAELRTVVNIVDRGNVYLVAKKGLEPAPGQSMADFVRGKSIAVGFAGGTPNSILRYLADKWKLDPSRDVKLVETANAGILAAVKAGQAQIAVVTEPQITQGITQGLTGEPFYNVPKELGPYAYSTINVQLASIQKDPQTVEKFVHAMMKGLQATYANPAEAADIARQEFPTMPAADLKASIDRSFADQVWSHDGNVTPAAWATSKAVVMAAGLLKQDVPYEGVIDTRFVATAKDVAAK